MCGIAGYLAKRPYPFQLAEAVQCLHHRGPDQNGVWERDGTGLGHARLSIIDLSDAGRQPMSSPDGRYVLVFNGEIYNFRELRRDLEAAGEAFRSHSDTEVLLRLYQREGAQCLEKLRGMFAFAIWDIAERTLFLARDRLGVKPLVYTENDAGFLFASEIPALFALQPDLPRTPDYSALDHYLTFQYIPAPLTGFAALKKLPPAHAMIVRDGKIEHLWRYWDIDHSRRSRLSFDDACDALREKFLEAAKLRLVSDVPLGAFLSGGIDSSITVAAMAHLGVENIKTFAIGFEEQKFNELPYARQIAEHLGTDHHEMVVKPDAIAILPQLVRHFGEPMADNSAIPTYYVSKMARERVTVVLNGDGGDESFLGYTRYLSCKAIDQYDKIPPNISGPLRRMISISPEFLNRFRLPRHARAMAIRLLERRSRRYEPTIAYFSDAAKQPLYGPALKEFLEHSALDRLDDYLDGAPNMVAGAAWADIHTYLPDDLMVKVDIASMAHSLEARSPFLDHKLMEWAATIPAHQRFTGKEPKSLLKKAMEPHLPHDLMYRPKMGFGVPIDVWLRGEMKEFAYDTLLSGSAKTRDLFDLEHVEFLLDSHQKGENRAYPIWALLMLELWYKMWIDSRDPFSDPTAKRIIAQAPSSQTNVM
ncbi:MAG TPA: asparagine synthase (glutamine-hydrolyzing) [Betaproteobacteria bacterium]|nr:asparagine synthase (glutamine-hydrolyzing) [Betaproteobacteria bacterium]